MQNFIDNSLLIQTIDSPCVVPSNLAITLPWPSFLQYVCLGKIFETFPSFDQENPLYAYLTSSQALPRDIVIRIYDQFFVECLTYVKAIPQINPLFFLQKIQEKETPVFLVIALQEQEKRWNEAPLQTLHDLILYLAFDRVCVGLAKVFEHPSSLKETCQILKECLLESFSHIHQDGKTEPGFFRLVEALFALQMREENLSTYTEEEWQILCESTKALTSRDELIDLFYIEKGLSLSTDPTPTAHMLTLSQPSCVKARINLASYMIKKIQEEEPSWSYTLFPFTFSYL